MGRLLIADGSSQIYRTFHAMARGAGAHLTAPDGTPTGALVAFLQVLRKVIRTHEPDRVAIAFDVPGKTFRHELFPEYKAQRDKMPEELQVQLGLAHEALAVLGFAVVESELFEADDVIATLTERAVRAGHEVVVLTSDKDLVQLVRPGVKLHHAQRDHVYDENDAHELLGVPPAQVGDLLAIMGDTSDNIPGVPGIGDKGARLLIERLGDLETMLRSTEAIAADKELGPRRKVMAAALAEHADEARLARRLVALVGDVPLALELDDLKPKEPDRPACVELFGRLGLTKLLDTLGLAAAAPELATLEAADNAYRIVADVAALETLAKELRAAGRFALDTETNDRRPVRATLVGLSVATAPGRAAYVPVAHAHGVNVPLADVQRVLGPVLADPTLGKIGQNAKFDIEVLARHGLPVRGLIMDTMIASYLLDSSRRSHALDQLAADHLGYQTVPYSEVARRDGEEVTLDLVAVETVADYCCEDSDIALQLGELFAPRLAQAGLRQLFDEIELPLVPVLAAMELAGVRVDPAVLGELSEELTARLSALTTEIHGLAGREINIASPKQLGELLFDELGLKPRGRTAKSGARSTAVEVLEQLAAEHPLPGLILEHRELAKLKGTYLDTLPLLIEPHTGRVHPSYNQSVAATGRLSCSDPNLQNIPIRTALGRRIRRAFVPAEGHVFVGADYSQVELRVMAHVSADATLIESFERGVDIHSATAQAMFGVPPESVTPELRARAKEINFGVLYGMSAHGLAQRLRIARGEAQAIIDRYFSTHPGVRDTVQRIIAECREAPDHAVRTLFGRVRHLPEIVSRNQGQRSFAERAAVNSVIQGTAADLIKLAMIALHDRLAREETTSRLILQVHDELLVEAPEDRAAAVETLLEETMAAAHPLRVPLEVHGAVGHSWYELK